MDEALNKSGDWPNVALVPGTHAHAATGEHVEQPENTRIGRSRGADSPETAEPEPEPAREGGEPEIGEIAWHREVIDGYSPSDCPYCGCERVVIGEYEPCHDDEWGYHIEHKNPKEAIGRKCFEMYAAFKTPEDAVRGADMRAPEWAIPINEDTMRVLSDVCREQSKKQLRAEAVERLKESRYHTYADYVRAMLGWGHEPHFEDSRDALIDLLTDDEPKQTVENQADSRENLEVDMFYAVTRLWNEAYKLGSKNGVGGFKIDEPFYKLLDRQAAITRAEWCSEQGWWDSAEECNRATAKVHDMQAQVDELTIERDDLRSRLKTQADSFQKLERDNAQLRVKLERVRELAGDDAR